MMASEREVVLEARHVTKTFPGVVANQDVSLKLYRGEVLGLLGENGAGKTTLMNILYGLYHQDSGEILVRGEPVRITSPSEVDPAGHRHGPPALHAGARLHGRGEHHPGGGDGEGARPWTWRARPGTIRELSRQFNLDVDPDAYVKDLSVGQQQRVEIIKALYRQADILILDEPTAVLTPQETDDLFAIIRSLTAQGTSVIFISHKLKEVLAISDRIVVLRRGVVVGETTPAQTGERADPGGDDGGPERGAPGGEGAGQRRARWCWTSAICGWTTTAASAVVDGVSLRVRAGEIVGIAGVQGNGQTELVEALTGLRKVVSGR